MFKAFRRLTLQRQQQADLEHAEMQAHLHEMAAEEHDAKAMMYRARALRLRTDLGGYTRSDPGLYGADGKMEK